MTRGEATQTKVFFKGADEDFVIFVDDVDDYKKWLADSSVPLAHFVSSFQVFATHRQGPQGPLNAAAKGTLENEFGTSDTDAVIQQILKKGTLQETETRERQGVRNESQGGRAGH